MGAVAVLHVRVWWKHVMCQHWDLLQMYLSMHTHIFVHVLWPVAVDCAALAECTYQDLTGS